MTKCLVTKLQGSVTDNTLRKIDEIAFEFETNNSRLSHVLIFQASAINTTWSAKVRIVNYSSGTYLTNYAGNANYGDTHEYLYNVDFPENPSEPFNLYIGISPNSKGTIYIEAPRGSIKTFFNSLAVGVKIETDKLYGFNNLLYVNLFNCNGELTPLVNRLLTSAEQVVINSDRLSRNIEVQNLDRLIASNLTLYIRNTNSITGFRYRVNIAQFKKSSVVNLGLSDTIIYGDISDCFPKITSNLIQLISEVDGLDELIYGDLAGVALNGGMLALSKRNCSFTWSNRPSNAKILAISQGSGQGNNRVNLGNYVDAMLINQATLEVGDKYFSKVINVTGNRTAASDAAIATLAAKGFTVTVLQPIV